jgi:peptide/nickel transport system permease protein
MGGLRRGLRSAKVRAGLIIIGVFVFIAIFGPVIYTTNPSALSSAVLQPPSAEHLLGTTQTGQDVLAQLIDGTRTSMLVGFTAAAIATLLSLLIGVTAGYLGGAPDEVLSVLANMFLVIPALPLVIVIAGYLPSKGPLSVTLVIAATGWAWGARVLRAQTLSLRRRDFVQAARATGQRPLRIVFSEILPNQLAVVAALFLGTFIYAILTEASLAFLGLGDVSSWSWGTILYWAQGSEALEIGAWWWFVPPGLAIAIVGMGLSLINFGIDEFVNPRLRAAGVGTKAAGKALRRQAGPVQVGRANSGTLSPAPDAPAQYGRELSGPATDAGGDSLLGSRGAS